MGTLTHKYRDAYRDNRWVRLTPCGKTPEGDRFRYWWKLVTCPECIEKLGGSWAMARLAEITSTTENK